MEHISRIFAPTKVCFVKFGLFSQINIFFGGPLTGEFVHFAMNCSVI